jgi:hypothetical protein
MMELEKIMFREAAGAILLRKSRLKVREKA